MNVKTKTYEGVKDTSEKVSFTPWQKSLILFFEKIKRKNVPKTDSS